MASAGIKASVKPGMAQDLAKSKAVVRNVAPHALALDDQQESATASPGAAASMTKRASRSPSPT
jgi:hypothetical protein